MAGDIRNMAASVHQQLLNKARETAHPFNELLQYYAIERFLYRPSRSPHANRFVLKGALMFSTWCGLGTRPTMDIDFLGNIDNKLDTIRAVIQDACDIRVEQDGMSYEKKSVTAVRWRAPSLKNFKPW